MSLSHNLITHSSSQMHSGKKEIKFLCLKCLCGCQGYQHCLNILIMFVCVFIETVRYECVCVFVGGTAK